MRLLFLFITTLSCFLIYAQPTPEILDSLYQEVSVKKHNNINANKTLTEINRLLKNEKLTADQRMKALMILANLHKFKGDRATAIETAESAISQALKEKLYLWQARFLGFTSTEYRESNITELGRERLTKAIEIAQKAPQTDELFRFNKNAYYEMAYYSVQESKNYREAIAHMNTSNEWAKQIHDERKRVFSTASNYQFIGTLHNRLKEPDSALFYLREASRLIDVPDKFNTKTLINYIYNAKGEAYLAKEDFPNAKKHFDLVLQDSVKYRPTSLNKELYDNYVDYYQMTGNIDSLQIHKTKSDSVSQLITQYNSEAINTVTRQLNKHSGEQSHTFLYYLMGTVVLITGIWGLSNSRIKKSKEKEKIKPKDTKSEDLQISDSTQQRILGHINIFEENQEYLNPKMSATLLANQFETNTKYLTLILKKTYDKDFTTYINELRINHIIKLLEEEPKYRQYKISYLAEVGGYSSHSKFTTIFKKVKDCSPSEFIKSLK